MHGSLSANVSSMAHLAKPSLFRAVKSHAVCFDLIRSDWIVRFFFMYGSNVRGSKELSWYGIDGCYQQYWNQPKGKSYYLVDGYAHLFRSRLWSRRSLRRYGYRNRWRCRCQSECTTT
ncbi:hypothetical protein Bca52824_049950 [Brassica carinata]|uniref:Uncharacterized protein n=1 Tax=Brassica carinata TaxID=52824 RepID=A0A8X7UVR3_BRACI|nr:hypothetical protein Bca52824_049950 [Brassica carinata]